MSTLPPDVEDERSDAPGAVATDERANAPPSERARGVPVSSTGDGRAEFTPRVTLVWSPPPANDTADPRWSLLALVDEFAALAADLHLRGRLGDQECAHELDLGKESDD
jgi:hypothetical protein